MRAAGYSSGAGLLLSIVVIVVSIVRARSIDPQRRARSYLAASAIVVALSLWSSFNIFQNARIDREVASARPEINAIMQAAAAEATLINSGQLASTDVSNAWKAYATPASAVEILDRAVPLRLRLVELMRRAKSRELDLARATRAAVDAADIAGALSPHQLVLGLPRSSEDEMVGGRVRSVRGSAAAFDQVVQQELQTIDMIQEVIRLVDAHGASAQVADGKLKLSDANAQAQYEATMLRLGFTEG
jgi:hypothetical protein